MLYFYTPPCLSLGVCNTDPTEWVLALCRGAGKAAATFSSATQDSFPSALLLQVVSHSASEARSGPRQAQAGLT